MRQWERVPPVMVPLTILHHTLAIAMVIPMNAIYCVEIKSRAPQAIGATLSPWQRRLDGV